ncbi:MAG: hypothetical protein IJQ84_09505 [Paludibacteraceae bacterium]|nr:hypothetical protein [Paludibacteraceae bacterium]
MDLVELYRYFAKFVPLDVLKKNYIKSGTEKEAAQIQAEVMNDESDRRIDSIGDFIFIGDSDFVLQKLRNSNKQIFMVDSDKINYTPRVDDGSKMSLGVSVCEHYNRSNTDVVSELAVQNRCLETLKQICDVISEDAESGCLLGMHLKGDFEIHFLDAKALNGLIGYTAFFTFIASDYGQATTN